MKKILILPIFLVSSLFLFNFVNAQTNPLSGRKVIIDAGHGGSDPGSIECTNYPEKTANLEVANELKFLLESSGATVYMTRTDDSSKSNADRYNFANTTDGEVLISIHLNGSTNHSIDGTQGLYGKKNKDLNLTNVMHNAMWDSLKSTPNFNNYGVTNFASGVLLKSDMPATIQETVFISNTDECNALKAGTRQGEIADALYTGLFNWFSANPVDGGDGGDSGDSPKCTTPPCGKNK